MPEILVDFWGEVEGVWTRAFFGVSIGHYISAFIILCLSYLLRHFVAHVVAVQLKKLTLRSKTEIDDEVVEAVEKPLAWAPVAFGFYVALRVLAPPEHWLTIGEQIVRSMIAIIIFWALIRLVDPIAGFLSRRGGDLTGTVVSWVQQALKLFFAFLGAGAVLQIWGIPVLPILASFSLLSVAIALGAQDLFKNLIGGATILVERRFSPGDWVKVDGVVEGTVDRINFRSTQIRRFDKAPVQVPNAVFSDNAVINFSRMTHRRIYWIIGIDYRASIQQLRTIRDAIETYVSEDEAYAPASDVSTFVRIDGFSDSSIDLMLYCFTKTTDWGAWLKIKEELALKIVEIVEGAGAGFAFPSQSIYVEKIAAGAEVFDPAVAAKA